MINRRSLLNIAAATLMFGSGGSSSTGPGTPVPQPQPQGPRYFVQGAVRSIGGVWSVINDFPHVPLNIDSVSIYSPSELLITYASIAATMIHKMVVVPDEWFAARGYVFGASVDVDHSLIQGSCNGKPVDWRYLSFPNSNLWIDGAFS